MKFGLSSMLQIHIRAFSVSKTRKIQALHVPIEVYGPKRATNAPKKLKYLFMRRAFFSAFEHAVKRENVNQSHRETLVCIGYAFYSAFERPVKRASVN